MPVVFIKGSSDSLIEQAARRMEPKLRAAFLRAVEALKSSLTDDLLAMALATGDVNQALALLALDDRFVALLNGRGIPDGVQSLRDALQATVAEGSKAAVMELPSRVSLNLSFNLMSAESQAFIESYEFPLIRQISASTTEGIRGVLLDAFRNGGHPYEQARRIRTFVGLTDFQSKAVLNYRSALSSSSTLGRTLDRALRDGRFDGTVQRAVRNNTGLSAAQVDRMTDRYAERYVKYRAETIARTESIRASVKGQREVWRQAVAQNLLSRDQKRQWITSGDDRTCEICLPLDGVVVGMDEEFAPGIFDPPDSHSDCRCSVSLAA